MILISLLVVSAGQLFGASGDDGRSNQVAFSFLLKNNLKVPISIISSSFLFPNIASLKQANAEWVPKEVKAGGLFRVSQRDEGSQYGIANVINIKEAGRPLKAEFFQKQSPGKYKGNKLFVLMKDNNNKIIMRETIKKSEQGRQKMINKHELKYEIQESPSMKDFLEKLKKVYRELSVHDRQYDQMALEKSGLTQASIYHKYGLPLNDIEGTFENEDLTEFTRNLARFVYDLYVRLPEGDLKTQ